VFVTGAPHPLQTQVLYEWTAAGTTVEDLANFINKKYTISTRLANKLVILVDGVAIPRDQWATTILKADQAVTYKSIAEGRNATRLLLTIAVVVIAVNFGVNVGTALGFSGNTAIAVGNIAINMVGMALVNAIAPIRMPGQNADPGQSRGLNLFTGASNQANRFGAIPVVLGKMRATGVLGATPYVDTLTDTSLLNLLIVWGFGPLKVEDICIGTNPISNYFNKKDDPNPEFVQDVPLPVTLEGYPSDVGSAKEQEFNAIYPRDVEQQQVNVQLVNNSIDGNPWQNVVFAQDTTTSVDLAFTFPEGMRQLVVQGNDAGAVREANATIEIQLRKKIGDEFSEWGPRPTYSSGPNTDPNYTDRLTGVTYTTLEDTGDGSSYNTRWLYQWHTYALNDKGEIVRFSGAATESQNSEPSLGLINSYKQGSYANLSGSDADSSTFTRIPVLPLNGFRKLYTVCVYSNIIVETVNHLTGSAQYTGLELTSSQILSDPVFTGEGSEQVVIGTVITITPGTINSTSDSPQLSTEAQVIFNSRIHLPGVTGHSSTRFWAPFLNRTGVWFSDQSITPFESTANIYFPYSGFYNVKASADDGGAVYVNNRQILEIPYPGYNSEVSELVFLEQGTYPVRVFAKNTGGLAAIGCEITYNENGGLNNSATPDTILNFGAPGWFHKRKDAFNFVYKIRNLSPGIYEARVRRVNDDNPEPEASLRNYNRAILLSATAYGNPINPATGKPQGPINKIPNTNLAKTAIRIQSTSKVNGNVDGVNAIVQSICWDWDRDARNWQYRPTSNPASLFVHVLLHPANAYRIKLSDATSQIDVNAIQKWHEFCQTNGLEFNSIVSQTQSVMDILRDICASGRASPGYVDGKWTVIVDEPRAYVTQHFTPHNSWGFESSKLLPRLPDAFRVTFANEQKAYQADELIVFNFGKTAATAEIFEELSLPGVTNARQAKHLARWHLAQTKLRPEVYTLNVDFEYLVCNRGDLVRVSHDVPLWGTSTGRITGINISSSSNILELSEPVSLEANTAYQIRIRTNVISPTGAPQNSLVYQLKPITVSQTYTSIDLVTAPGIQVEVDNLYMLGELSKESQELVVLSVEPNDNTTARLTLSDYSPEIYSINLDSDEELPSFNANITGQSNEAASAAITQVPIIVGANSDSSLSEEVSTGVFQNVLIVSFGNVPGLPESARRIQVQVVSGDTDFSAGSLFGVYNIDKSASTLNITGLRSLVIYKIRARYTNDTGRVTGPWTRTLYVTSLGKIANNYTVPTLLLDLENTFVTAVPTTDVDKPSNFKTYEYRMFKDTGTEDFWELDVVSNNIQVIQTTDTARFDLLKVAPPRISETGITYRVACRALDTNNNYSTESALGTIVVTTIT
jgi:sulfur carrier protein ThiS